MRGAEEPRERKGKKTAHWEDAEHRKRKAKKEKQKKSKKHAEFQMVQQVLRPSD